MAAAQFARQKAQNLYNNAPITQAVKQRSFQPLVTAMGNNAMSFMGTSGMKVKDPFIPGSNYVRQSWKPGMDSFQREADRSLANDAIRNKMYERTQLAGRLKFNRMKGMDNANSAYPPERLINNFINKR